MHRAFSFLTSPNGKNIEHLLSYDSTNFSTFELNCFHTIRQKLAVLSLLPLQYGPMLISRYHENSGIALSYCSCRLKALNDSIGDQNYVIVDRVFAVVSVEPSLIHPAFAPCVHSACTVRNRRPRRRACTASPHNLYGLSNNW